MIKALDPDSAGPKFGRHDVAEGTYDIAKTLRMMQRVAL